MTGSPGQETSPSRRDALRIGATGLAALLAGCTGDVGEEFPPNVKRPTAELVPSLPVRERNEIAAAAVETVAGDDVSDPDGLVAAVEERGISVESIERVDDDLAIEFDVGDLVADGVLRSVALVAGGYAALVDAGEESEALEMTIADSNDGAHGHAEVQGAWARRYVDGELTAAEYGELVRETIETE